MLGERRDKYKKVNRWRCDDIPAHSDGSVFDFIQFRA